MEDLGNIFWGIVGIAVLVVSFLVIPRLMKKLERNPEDWRGGGDVGPGSTDF